ncbi:unnamed protein product [Bursaphelenchus okinawaensis]|uniref:Pescadillo homolog n=1 Tax=Bursaphelenchus okinawaensis TaxID=465554 RepID=A0A811L511_9BILA|nr:unnamed protein product [Bursaphelenchus okinawaensis]CAG9117572.1 unnamed protein product [Bursaphelenchus okinawaensis]
MTKAKKAGTSGAATAFVSRNRALRKLQLSLKDFRRLCIIKGIYPREPLHRKKAQGGSSENRVLYSLKDIKFLQNEPLINKFREDKIFMRKIKTARVKRENGKIDRLIKNRPEFELDHIVRERYPTFTSAIRDMDDCLCLIAAFSVLPQTRVIRRQLIDDCRRFLAEFYHYIIEAHALTKVFVSIKGVYYQASIFGEKVTWLVGHEQRAVGKIKDQKVDIPVMTTFVQFYTTMLKFVNFRLYKGIGLYYPPKMAVEEENHYEEDELVTDKIYSIAKPLVKKSDGKEDQVEIDTFDTEESSEQLAQRMKEAETLRSLFAKNYFWLGREVPKEALTLVIRNSGGHVCWDDCPAKLYDEKSPVITHVIVDRPNTTVNASRKFVQPQWVFDSFNARRLLPEQKYAPGAKLPPHLSPFVEEKVGDYVPIERIEQLKADGKDVTYLLEDLETTVNPVQLKKKPVVQPKVHAVNMETGVAVKKGRVHKDNPQNKINQDGQELKMREMMIPKRFKRAYKKIKHGQQEKKKEVRKMHAKRLAAN